MNTAILANKTAINGKADKSHTHTKSDITDFPTSLKNPNALTINGKTYDGSSAVNAGVQTVANGGTGVTSQADINKAFIGDLEVGDSNVTDSTEFVSSYASDNGFSDTNAINKPYKRKFSKVWNYIKGKADSIYAASSHTHTKSQITDFPTSLPANGGTATKATQDGNGNVITSTYVKKSGDTLTGPIVMKADQCTLETAQLDMKNSDIKGANAIWFDDHAGVGEGLKFPRSSGSNYDFMRLDDGKIKVAPNVTGNANTATESIVAYTSDIPTSLPANGGTADKATSVVDYGDTSKTIQIGYMGAGATVDNLSYIAGYLTGGTQIKDVSKSVLQAWLDLSNYLPLSGGTVTGATQFNNFVKLNAWDKYGTGTANLWYDGNNKFVEIQNATDLKLSGVNVSKEGHTHTKSDVGLDKVNNTADSDKSVKYASSAGSVSWANVSDKPAYITGSYSNGVLNLYTN